MFSLTVAYVLAFSIDLWGQLAALFEQPQTWGVILSLIYPLAIAVLKQPAIPDRFDRPIAWGFSFVAGVITVALAGGLDLTSLVTTIPLVVVATELSYKRIWKGTYPLGFVQAFTDVLRGKPIPPANGPEQSGRKDALYKN